jgi:glyoxylase-like metal-dependent hydrolase (beta-lactamase superfamily II)
MFRIIVALSLMAGPLAAAPSVQPLTEGLYWLRGEFVPGSQPDGNSVLLRGDSGWIVVDSGRHAAHAAGIADFIAASGRPLTDLVNTHWHLDHVGGNPALRARHPALRVHASNAIEAAMAGFLARYRAQLETRVAQSDDADAKTAWVAEIAIIDAGKALYPDAPIARSERRTLDGRRLHVGFVARAVTEGDVWLYDRATRTLVAGDLVTLPVPFFDTACPARWQRALSELDRQRFRQLIPGHGRPMTRREFGRYRSGFDRLLRCADSDASIAACSDGWIADVGTLLENHDEKFTRALLEYYLGQVLRGSQEAIAVRCKP